MNNLPLGNVNIAEHVCCVLRGKLNLMSDRLRGGLS